MAERRRFATRDELVDEVYERVTGTLRSDVVKVLDVLANLGVDLGSLVQVTFVEVTFNESISQVEFRAP